MRTPPLEANEPSHPANGKYNTGDAAQNFHLCTQSYFLKGDEMQMANQHQYQVQAKIPPES